jgi:hypothetical protein
VVAEDALLARLDPALHPNKWAGTYAPGNEPGAFCCSLEWSHAGQVKGALEALATTITTLARTNSTFIKCLVLVGLPGSGRFVGTQTKPQQPRRYANPINTLLTGL